jgi:hypothetical protein
MTSFWLYKWPRTPKSKVGGGKDQSWIIRAQWRTVHIESAPFARCWQTALAAKVTSRSAEACDNKKHYHQTNLGRLSPKRHEICNKVGEWWGGGWELCWVVKCHVIAVVYNYWQRRRMLKTYQFLHYISYSQKPGQSVLLASSQIIYLY